MTVSLSGSWPDLPSLRGMDPTTDVVELTRQICDVESVSGDEAGPGRRDRGGAAGRRAPGGAAGRRRRRRPDQCRPPRAGGPCRCTSTRSRWRVDATAIPQPSGSCGARCGRGPARPGDRGHEGRGRRPATAGGDGGDPSRDVTYVFYDNEEVDRRPQRSGPTGSAAPPNWIAGDFAVLLEPTDGTSRAAARAPCGWT